MQEKSLIKKNILLFIENKGVSKYKFYKETGITRGVLDQNNGMSEENTARFIAYFPEVNIEWLLTGQGAMLKGESQNTNTVPLEESEKAQYENSIKALENTVKDKDKIIILQEEQINMLKYLLEQADAKAVKNVG